ncbi:unnamed protein product [Pleuronectes platessa]|uniref:Uncharacterized protein n=1 Tax=Pleuronectes platessa TaxID=8262 RepID=A0A9N7TWS1_PLEPL|nr:unnamed protein product [Pleuronectes platessa]
MLQQVQQNNVFVSNPYATARRNESPEDRNLFMYGIRLHPYNHVLVRKDITPASDTPRIHATSKEKDGYVIFRSFPSVHRQRALTSPHTETGRQYKTGVGSSCGQSCTGMKEDGVSVCLFQDST